MTNSFAHLLGKGGYGTVYKGKLLDDGRDVAVKILKQSEGNGEEFFNEVASLSRTSHVNIVSLLGFCYERNKRAIIYEFMPNGSLDKFISENMSVKMEWERLYDIAVGVSRGLEYLHNGCVSRIVHFDIKPQNILLDKDLCPKISDFGLAKLCKNKESIMSMLDARGTAGYIAPEEFHIIRSRNIEKVEHSGSNNSSMYFPDWIYKDFEREEIMRIFGDRITEEKEKIARKMVLVGLWCIQTNPSHRPAMIKVIEMLERTLEALQVPPKPLLCLPATTVPETVEDSNETSSFSWPSQFERGTVIGEDTLRISEEDITRFLKFFLLRFILLHTFAFCTLPEFAFLQKPHRLGSLVQNSKYRKLCEKSFKVTVPTSYVPDEQALSLTHLESVLKKGFEVKMTIGEKFCQDCIIPGGHCGLICSDTMYTTGDVCIHHFLFFFFYAVLFIRPFTFAGTYRMNRSIVITFGSVVGTILTVYVAVLLAFVLSERRAINAGRDHNLEALVSLRRYSYGQIKRITKSFTEVVGRGGFGTVYKGKLIASMSQTSHVNIVSMLGFCYEGSKRAIIYEFLENGSLDQSSNLDVSTLYGIALGVAKGIEYLHYSCKTRIKQESILSLLDTRGTVGYIAPELFSRMYGSVSHKSDVYSYGMLVLEMVGARNKRVENADANNSSVYFPDSIYEDLEIGNSTRFLSDEITQEEEDLAKKMILIGLWCVQLRPSDRPSMNKVVEMMEGSLDTLKAPPKHLLQMQNVGESSQPSGESS
ncbi:unnamed protein product, partial [Brassica oleracea var. botrytis]